MNYTSILKRAWQVTWRYRALWVFGVLLAIFSGGGGGNGGGGNGAQASQTLQYRVGNGDLGWLQSPPALSEPMIIGLIVLVLAFVLVMIALSIVVTNTAKGALIGMVDEVERTEATSVRSGFRMGWARFLRLFAISLVIGIPGALLIVGSLLLLVAPPIVLAVIGGGEKIGWLIALGVVLAIVLFPLWLLLTIAAAAIMGLLGELADRRCMLEHEGVIESIRQAYHTLRRHPRDIGLAWLILFGINLAFSIVAVPVFLIGLALVVAPALAAWAVTQTLVAAIAVGLPVLLVVIAAVILIEGIYIVFRSAVWTLVYREIAARGAAGTPEAPSAGPVDANAEYPAPGGQQEEPTDGPEG